LRNRSFRPSSSIERKQGKGFNLGFAKTQSHKFFTDRLGWLPIISCEAEECTQLL
jgi:hypothetical protein